MQPGRPPAGALFRCARVIVSLAFGIALSASAQESPQIVNGAQELAEPTVGALIRGDVDSGYVTCSVVLVGCDVAVTTAHCFNSNPQDLQYVYFQHAGFYPIESATRHPAYVAGLPPTIDFDALRVEDIAFIKLAEHVTGITPATLNVFDETPDGTPGRIVGFGRDPITSASAAIADYNAGIKRSGSMELAACEGSLAGEDILCWHPPAPQGPTGTDVTTCDGDSGGPLFIDDDGVRVVAGVTKGHVIDNQGQPDLCIPPVDPYDTKIYRHRGWLGGVGGTGGMVAATLATPLHIKQCSELPQLSEEVASGDMFGNCQVGNWGESEVVRTCGFSGFLDAGAPTAAHSFSVPPDTQLLRVAFNGIAESNGSIDTNYYLRAGAPPTNAVYDCAAEGTGTVGTCEFDDPTAGTWYVLAEETLYQGEYQITVSTFAASAGGMGPVTVPAMSTRMRTVLFGLLLVSAHTLVFRRSRTSGGPPGS